MHLRNQFGRARHLAARLRESTSGVSIVEFAMGLPLLLGLGLTGLEVASLAMAHLRVSNIAMMTADGAARVRDTIDEGDIAELFNGAKRTGTNIKFAENARIILSSMEPNTAGANGTSTGQWIRWQRCDGKKAVNSDYGAEGKGKNDATLQGMGPATNRIAAQPGTAVMVVEVIYDYQPIVTDKLLGKREVKYISAFNVRQRTDQVLKNAGNIPDSQKYLCTRFSA